MGLGCLIESESFSQINIRYTWDKSLLDTESCGNIETLEKVSDTSFPPPLGATDS